MKMIAMITILALVAGCNVFIDTVAITKQLELESELLTTLVVYSDTPNVTIIGDEKVSSIQVEAKIEMPKKQQDNVILTLEQYGGEAQLKAGFNNSFNYGKQEMNLTVTVPTTLNVSVEDQSGDLEVINIQGDVEINDQSGDIVVENISGLLTVNDDAGQITIERTTNIVSLHDKAGDLKIVESGGGLRIIDLTGNIEVNDFEGDLAILDESGELTVSNVKGSVIVVDKSGDIYIDNIEADVMIEDAGSGELMVENIKGNYTEK